MTRAPDSLAAMLVRHAAMRQRRHMQRRLIPTQTEGVWVRRAGQRLLSFAGNDYLGLAASAHTADEAQVVCGAGASRLITGNHPAYAALEDTLASMKGTEAALVVGSGYLANVGAIPALAGPEDLVLMDRYAHACMIDGVRLSGAAWRRFRHNDTAHLAALLQQLRPRYRHCLLLTETVFSMDGDRAPLAALDALARTHDAWLMTDDAHGLGILPPRDNPAPIQMGTLSKAAGVYGGYICGDKALMDHLLHHARPAMFSTALPEALVTLAHAKLRRMQAEPWRRARVLAHAQTACAALGLPPAESAIVPLLCGEAQAALRAQTKLHEAGLYVSAIRPPTVPPGTARLRLSFSAAHEEAHVTRLLEALEAGYKSGI